MSSGVGINSECLERYNELKTSPNKSEPLIYVVYGLNPTNTEVVVLKTSKDKDYETFLQDLPAGECRWAVYDFEYEAEDGAGKRKKLVFYSWSPDDAKIKQKMVFAASKDALRRSLVGIATEIQGTDESEVAHEIVLEKVRRTGH